MWVAAPILPRTRAYRRAEALARLAECPDYRLARLAAELRAELPELPEETSMLRSFLEETLRSEKIVAAHYQHVDGTSFAAPLVASCCGIVGGQWSDVLREFAALGIRVAEAPENAPAWAAWGDKGYCNVLIEQFLLNAVVEYRRELEWLESEGALRVAYLFASDAEAYDPARAEAVGYTHLIGGAKQNPELMADLEARMFADYPEIAERCRALASE